LWGQWFLALTVDGEKPGFWDSGRLLLVKAVCRRLTLPLTPLTLPLTDLFKQSNFVKARKMWLAEKLLTDYGELVAAESFGGTVNWGLSFIVRAFWQALSRDYSG
jgi:hypothetical protein